MDSEPKRLNRTMIPDLFKIIAPFEMTFKVVHAQHYSPLQVQYRIQNENILNIGLCVPATCSNEEIHVFTQSYFDNKMSDQHNIFQLNARVLEVKNLKLRNRFLYKKSVSSLIGIMVIIYCLTKLASNREIMKKHPKTIVDSNNNEDNNNGNIDDIQTEIIHEDSIAHRIIDCFNYAKNVQQYKIKNDKPSAIPTIDGMRYDEHITL